MSTKHVNAHDPFGRCAPNFVADFTREDRVRLLGQFAESVLAGEAPNKRLMMFVASGIASWLTRGGSLTRDYWEVSGPQGCTVTESILWQRMKAATGVDSSSRRAHENSAPAIIKTPNPTSKEIT